MNQFHGLPPLPCGAGLDALVAQVADGVAPRDPGQQAGCRHCQAALARLGEPWSLAGRLAGSGWRRRSGSTRW